MIAESPQRSQIAHGLILDSSWSLSSIIIALLVGFTLNIIIGNVFGPNGLGVYNLTLSLYTSIAIIAALGIHAALVKYVAEFKNDTSQLNQLVSAGITIVLISGLIAATCLILLAQPLAAGFQIESLAATIPLIAIALVFSLLNKVLLALLNGLRQMRTYAFCDGGRYVALFVLSVGAIWLGFGINSVIAAIGLAELILLIILFIVSRQFFTFSLKNYRQSIRKLIRFGLQVVIGDITATWNSQTPALLAGWFLSVAEVGIFSTAMMYAMALLFLPGAVQRVTTPTISEYYSQQARKRLSHLINRAMKYSMLLLAVAGLGLGLLVEDIVLLVYPNDPAFLEIVPIVRILVVATIVRGTQISVAGAFSSIGKPHIAVALSATTLVVLISSSILLISQFGVAGATLGVAFTYFGVFAIFLALLHKVLQINPPVTLLSTIFLLLIISYAGGLFLMNYFSFSFIGTGLALAFFGLSIFLTRVITRDDLRLLFGR